MSPLTSPPAHTTPPAHVAPVAAPPSAAVAEAGWSTHVVRAGETLWLIAERYGLDVGVLARANSLGVGATLHVGDRLAVPTGGSSSSSNTSSVGRSAGSGGSGSSGDSYVVRAGDSLWDIAAARGVDVAALLAANGLAPTSTILPGQRLTIPVGAITSSPGRPSGDGSYVVRPGDTPWDIAVAHGLDIQTLLAANGLTSSSVVLPGKRLVIPGGKAAARTATKAARTAAADTGAATITVRAGDSLWSIAQRYGVSVTSLSKANGIGTDTPLFPGDRLRVVGSVASSAAAPSTTGPLARSASANLEYLNSRPSPSRTQVRSMVASTARLHGVDPSLALAVAWQESRWSHNAVSEANAIGIMQCLPSTGQWVSGMVGRDLDLLDPQDNVTCGVVLLRSLLRSAGSESQAIAAYYQGLASIQQRGLYEDTKAYVAPVLAHKSQM